MGRNKKQAFINDWSFVKFPEVAIAAMIDEEIRCLYPDTPECHFPTSVFTDFNSSRPISLLGRAVNDYRADSSTGWFTDGHRIQTSQVKEAKGGIVTTENTVYILGEINEEYKQWCESNGIVWQELSKKRIISTPREDR